MPASPVSEVDVARQAASTAPGTLPLEFARHRLAAAAPAHVDLRSVPFHAAVLWLTVATFAVSPLQAQADFTLPSGTLRGAYTAFSVISELPASLTDAPEAMLAIGRARVGGTGGWSMLRGDLVGGFMPGRYFLDGLLVGAQLSAAPVLTGGYLCLTETTFAELYPVVGGGVYAYERWSSTTFDDKPVGVSVVPSAHAGVGVRAYDRGDLDAYVTTLDLMLETRAGNPPRLLIRVTVLRPRR